jgi:hypothetical protein
MKPELILYPVIAMMMLVTVVTAGMLRDRIGEMKTRRIHPQKVASRAQTASQLNHMRAADNYLNLFEMPVMFYVLCLVLYTTRHVELPLLVGASMCVGLRYAHSAIQIGYNKVMQRFWAFVLSNFVLIAMWVSFALWLLAQRS